MDGWISLQRKFLNWRWFDDDAMVRFFIYVLLKANHADMPWQDITIKRGQFVTSLDTMSRELYKTTQQVRTMINRLKSTGEITSKSTNKYTIITICKYDIYQSVENETNKQTNKQTNKRTTNEQQTNNKRITTNNKDNNNNNDNNDNNSESLSLSFSKFVGYWNEMFTNAKYSNKSKADKEKFENVVKVYGKDRIWQEMLSLQSGKRNASLKSKKYFGLPSFLEYFDAIVKNNYSGISQDSMQWQPIRFTWSQIEQLVATKGIQEEWIVKDGNHFRFDTLEHEKIISKN